MIDSTHNGDAGCLGGLSHPRHLGQLWKPMCIHQPRAARLRIGLRPWNAKHMQRSACLASLRSLIWLNAGDSPLVSGRWDSVSVGVGSCGGPQDPQAPDRPALAGRRREADHQHIHRPGGGGGGHHRRCLSGSGVLLGYCGPAVGALIHCDLAV